MKYAFVGDAEGIFLSFIQIINTFTFYGLDIGALALLTCAITQLIKRLFFKTARKKLVTFMPFIIGTALYAVYAVIRNLSFEYLLNEYVSILEHGISVGAVATLYYVLYEQFIREKDGLSETEGVIATLLEGYVPAKNLAAASKAVASAIEKDVTGNGAEKAQKLLSEYSDGKISENDILLLSRLIIETLAHLTTK